LRVRIAAILSALLAISGTIAGCSRVTPSLHNGASLGGANEWTHPGVLRIGGRLVPDNLNLLIGTQAIDTDLGMLWADFLLRVDDKGELVPDLATEVPTLANGGISRDGLTIIYHLHRNVKWQDGAPFDADDVIFTYNTIMNRKNFVVTRAGYELISSIAAPDKYTIVVHLAKPYAPFVRIFFAVSSTSFCVLPKHLLAGLPDLNRADFNNHPIGTGPFKVVSYEKDVEVRFVANPSYFRGPPRLREIEYHIVPSDNTLLTQIKTHEIDVYYRASEAQMPSLTGIPGTKIYATAFTRFGDIGFNGSHPPLDDVRVRRALAYATNKADLIAKITHGVNIPADSDQPPFLWAFDPNVRKYPFDPARARALLDAAGWVPGPDGIRRKNGQPLLLVMSGYTGSATLTATQEVVQREWRDVGVDVEIKDYPSDILYAPVGEGGIEQSGKFDAIVESWGNGSDPDDYVLFGCANAPPNGWNVYHICDPQLEAAEHTALISNDPAVRKAQYAIVQERLADQVPVIFLWFERYITITNSDFTGYRPSHVGSTWWNPWEWSI
jgi:peptide/nickel transport system substrate-binding protein